jgi:ComF family protein
VQVSIQQNCLVCRQPSQRLVCTYCSGDLAKFDGLEHKHNLLNWPPVQRGLKTASFSNLIALADYQWPLSTLLTGLKFSAKLPNALALAELFYQYTVSTLPSLPDAIIPLPLHPSRYRQRTFNQSIEIAKQLGKLCHVPVDNHLLRRIKKTKAQTELSASQRKTNLQNAFALCQSQQNKLHEYQHIALFDDVVTTGATMDAAYQLLVNTKYSLRIDIWCICLTLEH